MLLGTLPGCLQIEYDAKLTHFDSKEIENINNNKIKRNWYEIILGKGCALLDKDARMKVMLFTPTSEALRQRSK